jgi:hypothetical protein
MQLQNAGNNQFSSTGHKTPVCYQADFHVYETNPQWSLLSV